MHGLLLATVLVTGSLTAQQDAANTAFFESRIRPVLAAQCYSCHASTAKISFAGLQLDSRQRAMRGTDSGPVLIPGKPAESRLYQVLLYTGQAKMPPAGKLPAATIDDFRQWIERGAAWPEDASPQTALARKSSPALLDHWAWKPVAKTDPPPVRNAAWVRDPLDSFILNRLERDNLQPSAAASPRIWLRRVTFDLTGLPPTVEQQDRFLQDTSPESFAKVVDELLGSPAFGQRWGRHWLDQTYYADNIEIGRRVPARHAWRYRDYVIDSLQHDVPYNQFIKQQLAGDQLEARSPEERRRNIVATGFLALGPWPLVNADKEQLKMDVVDLQVDLVGRTFLGLTLGCARCHDHKFDPVSSLDYYGIAGIFSSTRTLSGRLNLGVFSNVNQVVLPELPEELIARAEETRQYWARLGEARKHLQQFRERRKGLTKDAPDAKSLDKLIQQADQEVKLLEYLPPVPATAHAVQDTDIPANCRINVRGNAHQLGAEAPRGGVAILSSGKPLDIADFTSGRKELAEWIASPSHPLTARVEVNRIWHHLFGTGLVASIDNFGTRGAPPSHPALLDYLATEFVSGGWSVKKIIRRIVLSSTYRQASEPNAKALAMDPENRLLWRMSRRRLEAETIRDAMLAVSGNLDRTAGGPSLPFYVQGNMNLAKPEFLKEEATLDPATRNRRSVYLPVLRKSQMPELDILNLFNFPDPNQITGARTATTIPTQALYLLNAPFVQEQAAALARAVLALDGSDASRVETLLRRVYARHPAEGETARLLAYVSTFAERNSSGGPAEARMEAWKRLCHSLLISNEFLYRS